MDVRIIRLIPAVLVLLAPATAVAQDWTEYYGRADSFRVNMPGEPAVQDTRYTSYFENEYPARVYSVVAGRERYTVTVVDYSGAQQLQAEKKKSCPAGSVCTQAWEYDVRGALDHATWKLIQRDTRLTFLGWGVQDKIEGRILRFTNADRSRSTVALHMHEDRLYILESTVPEGAAEIGAFHHSLQLTDKAGNLIRYKTIYINGAPAPEREEQEDNADFRTRTQTDGPAK
jgi:hypothetical protein